MAFCLAHLKCQRQLQAFGGGQPLGEAHLMTLAPASTIDPICTALDNLALVASNNTTVLQQLTATNLALTASVASLTTANKKLAEALAKKGVATPAKAMVLGVRIHQTPLFQVIIAGPMDIGSANTTQVQPAETRPWGTKTR